MPLAAKIIDPKANFIQELCKYYMFFLQNGFKSAKFPKRHIRFSDEKNFKIGIDLSKYEKFNSFLRKRISLVDNLKETITLKKGQYSVTLNETSLDLLKKLLKKIDEKDIEKIVNLISRTLKDYVVSHRNKIDEAYDEILEIVKKDLNESIVKPISEKMEPLIGRQSHFQLESLFTLEQGISEKILNPLTEGIHGIFNDLLANKKVSLKDLISDLFNKEDIVQTLNNYFETFRVKDLYYDIQEIVNSHKNLDKKEIYLYFCEIEIENKRFPLFYTQVSIQGNVRDSSFELSFSNELFVHKSAVTHAFSVLIKDEKKAEIFDEERKIYISEEVNLHEKLNEILNNLISKLRTEGIINLKEDSLQFSKSINFIISNNFSLCVFDKSDESLINDFEDILDKIKNGEESEIATLFQSIITDFLLNEPEVINEKLEDSWDTLSVSEKLNYKSPIPLNSEQLKILKALKTENCKYVVVEGPPGTGKSHTISAIAFDYILNDKSILILSDTKEALDVVENKINDTLDKVRGEAKIQNPILRLGKMGNTYNKILAKSSIDNIRDFSRAQKQHSPEIDKEINEISDIINDRIKIETEHYKYIDKEKFSEFDYVRKNCKKEDLIIDVNSFNKNLDEVKKEKKLPEDENFDLNIFIDKLYTIGDTLDEAIEDFKTLNPKIKYSFNNFYLFIGELDKICKYYEDFSNKKYSKIFKIKDLNSKNIDFLKKKLLEYENLTYGLLGKLFKKKEIKTINDSIKKNGTLNKSFDIGISGDRFELQEVFQILSIVKDDVKKIDIDFDKFYKTISFKNNIERLFELNSLLQKNKFLISFVMHDQVNCENLSINLNNIDTIDKNNIAIIDVEKKESIKKFYQLEEFFSKSFNVLDRFDYTLLMQRLQSLYTSQMTNSLDKKIIEFYDSNRNMATNLSKIIKSKLKFPKQEFKKLKEAFPCIISSVRDFANYIQLDKGIFDLIIIDEASQVSIAQAFPALIRAKKVLVLGDKKQFSNLQSYQAAGIVNNSYLNKLKKVFKENISKEQSQLVRLESFNIKTSILDFFSNISNYDARLKKHFRGYPEHIQYCSKTFYNSDLQAIRLRTKPINEIIKFKNLNYEIIDEVGNYNKKEAEFIIKQLEELKEKNIKTTVGIITPFTDQQKYLLNQITMHAHKDYFFENLKLKIMTFDTCQGEEREIVYYSLVDTKKRKKLNTIFPTDLSNKDLEENGDKRAQRLNVGFSRVQELMYFVLSKDISEYPNEIGNAIRYINNLATEEKLPANEELDPNSPMEKKVLEWFKKTKFYLENKKNIELKAQFEIGKYLKQLDPDYSHPKFVVDFLVIYKNDDVNVKQVIIEYDGLKDHFDNQELITGENFDEFYTNEHYEREKALETYGYNFIRLNKFNTQDDPVNFLDKKLTETFSKKIKMNLSQYKVLESVKQSKEGNKKYCERCENLKEIKYFKDASLKTGYGIVCIDCKGIAGGSVKKRSKNTEFKSENVKFNLENNKEYIINYINKSNWPSKRKIKIKEQDSKFIKAFDYLTNENRTFRKDRIKDSSAL